MAREQSCGCHDLARLTVSALNYLELEPRALYRLALRRRADRLDRSNGAICDGPDRHDAGPNWSTIHVHGACPAQRRPATKLGSRHAEHIAQYPQQGHISLDVDVVGGPVYVDREVHCLRFSSVTTFAIATRLCGFECHAASSTSFLTTDQFALATVSDFAILSAMTVIPGKLPACP